MIESVEDIDLLSPCFLSEGNKLGVIDLLYKTIKMGTDFKLRKKVLNFAEFSDLLDIFNEPLPVGGTNLESLLDFLNKTLLPYSMNFSSPFAMAFPDAGNSQAGLSASILSAMLNQNLINWLPCAPVGTVIEIVVLNWLREIVGYKVVSSPKSPLDVGGIITTGGVSSNTIAQLIARENICKDAMVNGLAEVGNLVCIVPNGIDHYSSRLAMGWLGLGEKNVIKAPTKNFKYDLPLLKESITELSARGKKIMSLTAYAGDSRSMTCDNFIELRAICDEYNIWLHVDGCHGTQLLFSDKLKSKLAGIELADSITFDPHKVMNVPYAIGVLLVKNQDKLTLVQRPEDIITGESHSFGQFTPFFGSRAFASLKLYMLFKNMGRRKLGQMIEKRHAMAKLLAQKVTKNNQLILVNKKVDINSVVFMYLPNFIKCGSGLNKDKIEMMNIINKRIQESLLKNGSVWLHSFSIPDLDNALGFGEKTMLTPLRFMSDNPLITEEHIDVMLNLVMAKGKEFEEGMSHAG